MLFDVLIPKSLLSILFVFNPFPKILYSVNKLDCSILPPSNSF